MSNGFSFDTTKFVLDEVKKEALKTAMEELVEQKVANAITLNSGVDVQELIIEIIKATAATVFDNTILSDKNCETIFLWVKGYAPIFDFDAPELDIHGLTNGEKLVTAVDIAANAASLTAKCNDLKECSDSEYFKKVKDITNAFLEFAESMAVAIPLVGDYIGFVIECVSNAFESQYDYIVQDKTRTDTAIAELALLEGGDKCSLFYLLSQTNLLLDKNAMVMFGLKKMNIDRASLMLNTCSEDLSYEEWLDFIDKKYNLITDADELRKYCKTELEKQGYNFNGMTVEEIGEKLRTGDGFEIKSADAIVNYAINTYLSVSSAQRLRVDPLIIDLDKNGFELTDVENGVHFDMDRNGIDEKTGWITGADAFLALDRNGDGIINDSGELFGDRTYLKNGNYANSGFQALAEYDDDLNGIINAHDEVYNRLLLWQDKNNDGISTEDELMSLSNAGISAINLGYESVNSTDEESGSLLANISSVVFDDGSETAVGEFKFNLNKIDTADNIKIDISDEIKNLPDVRAVGNVHSLHYEMAMDSSGTLTSLVKQFTESTNFADRKSILTDILYFICDASDIAPSSRGSYIDARQVAVIEKMTAEDFYSVQTGSNVNSAAAVVLKKAYEDLFNAYYIDLIYDGIKESLNFINVNTDENGNTTYDISFFSSYANFQLNYGIITETQLADIATFLSFNNKSAFLDFKEYFQNINPSYANTIIDFSTGIVGTDDNDTLSASTENNLVFGKGGNDTISGSGGNDIIDGGEGDDYLYGGYGNDILDGGKGNDYLYGGEGDDTYIFNKGYGTDVINDYNGLDTVKFGEGISPEDIAFVKNGNNLEICIKGTDDKVIIQYYFNNDNYSNFRYSFSDGTTWVKEDITAMLRVVKGTDSNDSLNAIYNNSELYGYGGNDTISGSGGNDIIDGGEGDDYLYGGYGNDILDGGKGNDYLYGGEGDDTYIFNKGYGTDVINDYNGLDTVKFGEGISPEDIAFVKNGNNLEICIKGTDDKVIIQYYFNNDNYSNFRYSFSDGTVATINKESLAFKFPELDNSYTFSSGDGQVSISDSEGEDVLEINADILNLMFSQNGDDLDIQLYQTDDKFTVKNWFAGENNQIESIIGNDGYALTNNQVQLLIENMSAFTSENNISWAEAITQDSSAVQSVLNQIWIKGN